MTNLSISYAGHFADRVQDLYYGAVRPEAIDLHFLPLPPVQAFNRMLRGEFDSSEMSFSSYVIRAAMAKRGGDPLPFVAIPVFPSRTFRHGAIYVNTAAGIGGPEDLAGRRIGVPEYNMTAAVWARGLLKDEYGVTPESIRWTTGGLTSAGRKAMLAQEVPGVDIVHEQDRTLDEMLVAGDLDGLIAPQPPPAYRNHDPRVARLFQDVTAAEQAYCRKTGLFPIMHTLVLRRDLYDRHPWVAASLYEAFDKAKNNCLARLAEEEPAPVSYPWSAALGRTVREIRGDDFWPYGVEPNRAEIETLCRYTHEQGLAPLRLAPEDLFAESVARLSSFRL